MFVKKTDHIINSIPDLLSNRTDRDCLLSVHWTNISYMLILMGIEGIEGIEGTPFFVWLCLGCCREVRVPKGLRRG